MRSWRAFLADESGATAIEYGLIAALIAAVVITAMAVTGGGIQVLFGAVADRASTVFQNASTQFGP